MILILLILFILLLVKISSSLYLQCSNSNRFSCRSSNYYSSNKNGMILMMAKDDDSISRRRARRRKSDSKVVDNVSSSSSNSIDNEISSNKDTTVSKINNNNSNELLDKNSDVSMEDMFGLGNEQLRELLEQELPIPREDLITGKAIKAEDTDKNKVFKLLDLDEFIRETSGKKGEEEKKQKEIDDAKKIDRSNPDEYLRVLQLNPFADSDDAMFLDEYDILPSIFGSGKILGIPVPFLQTGHGILLLTTLLAGFVYAPGNPLTEFPIEIRNFLKQGLAVTYAINTVLAVLAAINAKSKNLPVIFWALKTFLVGGVSYYEIQQAKDPKKMNVVEEVNRQSKRRRERN